MRLLSIFLLILFNVQFFWFLYKMSAYQNHEMIKSNSYYAILICPQLMRAQVITFAFLILSISSFSLSPSLLSETKEQLRLDLNCGFTEDFQKFLNKQYSSWGFERSDLKCGSYGGKSNSTQAVTKTPIIFLHGNSDIAFGRGTEDGYTSWQTGFRQLAVYLGSQGYKKSELYTTTWGSANPNLASQNNHAKKYVQRLRAFVQAVLSYTKAPQVNIIGHSMGVTLGRKIIKGGSTEDQNEGVYNIGGNLTSKVKSFIGLAGANLGLNQCYGQFLYPTCSSIDGFDPGVSPTMGPSKFLSEINNNSVKQGSNIYTIWSRYDDLIKNQCVVWGKITSRIPQQSQEVIKTTKQWTHFQVRDKSGPDLLKWL